MTPTPVPVEYVPTDFFESLLLSGGFVGLCAIGAALLAFSGLMIATASTRRNAQMDRDRQESHDRREEWWTRAQWGLEQTLSEDEDRVQMGFLFLEELAKSKLASSHEGNLIAAATDRVLSRFDVLIASTEIPDLDGK